MTGTIDGMGGTGEQGRGLLQNDELHAQPEKGSRVPPSWYSLLVLGGVGSPQDI